MELLLATGNAGKAREIEQMVGREFGVRAVNPRVEETGKTFAENAALKAIALSRQDRQAIVAADDSGLEVDSLGGTPGIFSARYAGAGATDQQNIDKLLRALAGRKDRAARFRCVIAVARAGELLRTFEGTVEGVIVDLPRGSGGFGYDPIFQPTGFEQTFGELPADLKHQISHRGRAIRELRIWLLQTQGRGGGGGAPGGAPG